MARSSVRLLVADTRRLYSEAICHTLARDFNVQAIADVGTLLDALPASDLLIIAGELALDGRLDMLRRARAAQPGIKLLVIGEPLTQNILQQYWKSGVSGFLPRDSGVHDLLQAVTDVLAGKRYCAPASQPAAVAVQSAGAQALTGRQAEVLRLVSEGLSAKEIAHRLHVSQRTVEFHKANIMRLLGLRSSPEMIRFAMEWRPDHGRYLGTEK
jgi:DNA-binding NarL/FixJ family response regulator